MIVLVQTIIHVANNSYVISVYTALHCNIFDGNCDCLACTVCYVPGIFFFCTLPIIFYNIFIYKNLPTIHVNFCYNILLFKNYLNLISNSLDLSCQFPLTSTL